MEVLLKFKRICEVVFGNIKGFKGVYVFGFCDYPVSDSTGIWYVEIGPVFTSQVLSLLQLTDLCKKVNKRCEKLPEEERKIIDSYEDPSFLAHGEDLCILWSCSAYKEELDKNHIDKYDTAPEITLKDAIENLKTTALDTRNWTAHLSMEDDNWEQTLTVKKKSVHS